MCFMLRVVSREEENRFVSVVDVCVSVVLMRGPTAWLGNQWHWTLEPVDTVVTLERTIVSPSFNLGSYGYTTLGKHSPGIDEGQI